MSNAARRLREKGLDGVGVSDLMEEAGFTVGGFYKHFASRDDLVVEAFDAMSSHHLWQSALEAAQAEPGGEAFFDALVDAYLHGRHRTERATGCPFAALSSDLSRSGEKVQAAATRKLETALAALVLVFGDRRPAARAKAIFLYSALVGAMSLARSTHDESLAREILSTVGKMLKKTLRPEGVGNQGKSPAAR